MYNISLNGDDIKLKPGVTYIVIDALYIDSIRDSEVDIHGFKEDALIKLGEHVFPYNDIPFAVFIPTEHNFRVTKIADIEDDNVTDNLRSSCFSSDTGIITFVNASILIELIKTFDYGELVDTDRGIINTIFWEKVSSKFDFDDLGIIVGMGINSPFAFTGSGTYIIVE